MTMPHVRPARAMKLMPSRSDLQGTHRYAPALCDLVRCLVPHSESIRSLKPNSRDDALQLVLYSGATFWSESDDAGAFTFSPELFLLIANVTSRSSGLRARFSSCFT